MQDKQKKERECSYIKIHLLIILFGYMRADLHLSNGQTDRRRSTTNMLATY